MSDRDTFEIDWGSFKSKYRLPDGGFTFVVVSDYESHNLWNDLLLAMPGGEATQNIYDRPKKGWRRHGNCTAAARWYMWNIELSHAQKKWSSAQKKFFTDLGIPQVSLKQLPAIFVIRHGYKHGYYSYNVETAYAIEFITSFPSKE